MSAKPLGPCAKEEMPESQRVTLPSPQPFRQIAQCKRSPGEYRLVDGQPQEDPQSLSAASSAGSRTSFVVPR